MTMLKMDAFYYKKRSINTIFSYNTVFHLLNLSERSPYELDVTRISVVILKILIAIM